MRQFLFFVPALAWHASGLAAQTTPAPVRVVPLAAVQVRPPQLLTLRAPGEGRTWHLAPPAPGQPRTWCRLAARTAQLRLAASL